MKEHGIEDEVDEVEGNGASDDQKKNGDVSVCDNFPFGDKAKKERAEAGRVGLDHWDSLSGKWEKASELAVGRMGVG